MKATEVKDGDQLRKEGQVVYTVLWVEDTNHDNQVVAGVRFADGGVGERVWDADNEVPLWRG